MSRAALKSIQAASGGGPATDTGDEYWGNTVLLLDGEGTDGGQNNTFTDSSSNSYTITGTGAVSQGSFSPYLNNWSAYFENADSNITFTPSFSFGSNDFCIEFWANFTETPASSIVSFFTLSVNTGDYLKFELNNAGNGFTFRVRKNNANDVLLSQYTDGSDYDTPSVWTHFAVTRSSNTFRFFVDGVLRDSNTFSGSLSSFTNGWIGSWTQITQDFKGYISNLRITNGSVPSSRQTSSTTSGDEIFTPPTSNLDTVTDTVLLTCRSNRFIDLSSSPHTLSKSASPKITTFSPTKDSEAIDIGTYGGSAYFDGSSYLDTASGATALGTGNLTVEFWINTTDTSFNIMNPDSSTGNGFWGLMVQSGDLRWNDQYGSTNLWVVDGAAILDGAWHHVAIVKNSNVFKVFYDGVSQSASSGTFNETYNYPYSDGLRIGSGNLDEFTGYLADVRLLAGTAQYSSDFDPPTAPLTSITNTKLLLNFEDSNIYDLTGTCNIETNFQASIDTSVKKYDSGSIQLDGLGDHLDLIHGGDMLDFPGDFTIEWWLYTTSTATQYMFDTRTASGQTNWAAFFVSNTMYFSWNGSTYTSAALSNYTNTWIHVAFVRSGSTGKWYIDGTASGSNHSLGTSTVATQAGTLRIGGSFSNKTASSAVLNGYIDDFRITNGVARYTANFTPSSEALPKF